MKKLVVLTVIFAFLSLVACEDTPIKISDENIEDQIDTNMFATWILVAKSYRSGIYP